MKMKGFFKQSYDTGLPDLDFFGEVADLSAAFLLVSVLFGLSLSLGGDRLINILFT